MALEEALRRAAGRRRLAIVRSTRLLLVGAALAAIAGSTFVFVQTIQTDGAGALRDAASTSYRRSPLAGTVRTLRAGSLIATNRPWALYVATRTTSRSSRLPGRSIPRPVSPRRRRTPSTTSRACGACRHRLVRERQHPALGSSRWTATQEAPSGDRRQAVPGRAHRSGLLARTACRRRRPIACASCCGGSVSGTAPWVCDRLPPSHSRSRRIAFAPSARSPMPISSPSPSPRLLPACAARKAPRSVRARFAQAQTAPGTT